jgi:hypothetical protein
VLWGVDFSGADDGGRAKIRIARRERVDPERPVEILPPSTRAELRARILASRDEPGTHLWRIDAPVGLPIATLEAHGLVGGWLESAEWMRRFGSARAWRSGVRATSRREPRRACDLAFGTPMAPMNLRVFKQTWTLICELLLPLAEAGVRIEPLWTGSPGGRVVVAEGCPASILRLKGWPQRGYKAAGEAPRARRAEVLEALRGEGLVVPPRLAAAALDDPEGDLLDALLLVTDPSCGPPPAAAGIEGWVY